MHIVLYFCERFYIDSPIMRKLFLKQKILARKSKPLTKPNTQQKNQKMQNQNADANLET